MYPAVVRLQNPAAQHRINSEIVRVVNRQLHEQGYPQNPQTEVTAYYEIKTNERQILSLSLINYAFSGGAHGLTLQSSLTFSTQTGHSYTLRELFKPGADYVKRLSDIVKAQLKARDIQTLESFKSIRPDQDFYIADKSLVLYFQLYEITPYVYGFPYFPISVYALQDILDENGPLGKMMY
ncbi:DUF3298 and DUF4163 domain-containing protein [Paenibacillus athensensis]|uniref:DUF3298 domain-containing protein n=1 Tax=Paenibacillus athensensis TaxID=1967502 RepID=A0A4Y8Q4V2_9BACL|nr:DUF3298 and DUF4163 domain-containing protein [Paenibacillus athensensis]MCD1258659.1 DUF3298 and DUF4163 domain-containing protein [Paenibacillus athensensis]